MKFIAWGAVGAALYGVVRGMQNGNFKQLAKNFPNMNLQKMTQPLQQMTQPFQGMTQPLQGMTQPLQGMTNNPLTQNLTK